MSKVDIIRFAKAVKKKIKKKEIPYISYCRKIERVKTARRICAMTFDDGPTVAADITSTLVNTLDSFGAKGTFDVIGTTESNYPDSEGALGTPSWSGTKFDHYPKYGEDKLAGAVNQGELIDMILSSGHEITNHTYSHVLFGKKNIIYSKRNTLSSFDEVYEDVKRLHEYLKDNHNYEMKLSRPPHYVDKIKGGFTSYDVYSRLGYNYLCASFDGAGWLPCESEEKELEAMVLPLKKALEENPDALCGQIIFQKDGFNMALRAPVKKGLAEQLKLLSDYGYEVVTVSELMEESPFADVGREDADFELFYSLSRTHAIVYSDNTLKPDNPMTLGELAMLVAPREISVNSRIDEMKSTLKQLHPYATALKWCEEKGYTDKGSKADRLLTKTDIQRFSDFFNSSNVGDLTRRSIYKLIENGKWKMEN